MRRSWTSRPGECMRYSSTSLDTVGERLADAARADTIWPKSILNPPRDLALRQREQRDTDEIDREQNQDLDDRRHEPGLEMLRPADGGERRRLRSRLQERRAARDDASGAAIAPATTAPFMPN